jgi:glucose/arabinose dehydrogenase
MDMRFRRLLPALVALLVLALTAPGAAALSVRYGRIVGELDRPVHVTNGGDARLFVVEQDGRIRIVKGTSILGTYLDIRTLVRSSADGGGSEEGLLSLAFHPQFRTSGAWGYGRFYVYYTYTDGNNYVVEYYNQSPSSNVATGTRRILLKINHPTYTNHNGGTLAFGRDGYLYLSTGDGGGSGDPGENAQDINDLRGKLLRFLPTDAGYSTSGNPFVGRTGHDLVWSYGLRNPWKFSFDRSLGTLWIGDVGQNVYEEVNRSFPTNSSARTGAGRGLNYGWDMYEARSCFEGPCSSTGKTFPVTYYSHTGLGGGHCSVTGGHVYRGSAYPAIRGLYFFADFCSGRLWSVSGSSTSSSLSPTLWADTPHMISSFGEGYSGELYFTTLGGELYRISGS